jgi:hypothetical protein
MRVLFVVAALLLAGCESTQGLSVHSFTNQQVEAALTDELPKFSQNVSLMGLPVQFDVNDVNVNIGPDKRDVVELGLNSSAAIKAFTFTYPVSLSLQVEGSPYYDSQKKAVFLRNVSLLNSSIDAGGFKGNLGSLNNQVMSIINVFLEDNPVYTLDMDNPKVALLSKLPLDIKVVEGAISIIPRLSSGTN